MAITDNYWFEISDLTVFQAAYWMQIGDDPRLHELRYESESAYADYYDDHPGACEAVSAKCEVILNAVRNEKISLPPAENSSRDTGYSYETRINKESWVKWCDEIGSLNNIEILHSYLVEMKQQLAAMSLSKIDAKRGITKNQALTAFAPIVGHCNLKKTLGDKPKWIRDACIDPGARGKREGTWNPIILAIALREKNYAQQPKLKQVFLDHGFLSDWRDEWKEKSEY